MPTLLLRTVYDFRCPRCLQPLTINSLECMYMVQSRQWRIRSAACEIEMAIPEVTPFCIPMHSILNLVISTLYVTSIPITSKFHHCLVTPKFKFSDVFIKPPYSTVLLLIYISRCLQEPIFRSNLSKLRPLMSCVPASYSPSHRYHLNLLQQPEYFDALTAPRCRLMA